MGLLKKTKEETTDETVITGKMKIRTSKLKSRPTGKIYGQYVLQKKKKKLHRAYLNQTSF